jgi:sulfhydrogenase subunit delta
MKENKKIKIGIFSLTSCEGCENVISTKPRELLKAIKGVELIQFKFLEDDDIEWAPFDVAFVEGSTITAENLELAKKVRQYAKVFVTLGNCAQFGGIHKMKNYRGKEKVARMIYKYPKTIENPDIYDMEDVVKVDYSIPTCPINPEEFLRVAYDLIFGRKPKIAERTVCYECQRRGFLCLLQRGEPCMGPITLGGCNAICLQSRMPCEACRGPYEGANFKSHFKLIDKQVGKARREEILEIFGVKDKIQKVMEAKEQEKKKI